MLITKNQLAKFSGVSADDELGLLDIYIGSATEIINSYLCFNCEAEDDTNPFYVEDSEAGSKSVIVPSIVKYVCLEIATLLQLEEDGNIGINNKNFSDSGSRTYLNITRYDSYLERLSQYRRA